ncbi:MAG: putative bifunctional diguanylate cyclase/phosphodiesterase [Thiohalomonadales bacterium]
MSHSISIRKRYFTIVVVTTVVLFAISIFVNRYFQGTSSNLLVSSRLRVGVSNDSHELIKHINESTRILDLYLIVPDEKYRVQFFTELTKAENILDRITKNQWIVDNDLTEESNHLHNLIQLFSMSSLKLMDIRINSIEMYPAIKIAENTMQQTHQKFLQAVNLAIEDTRANKPFNVEFYDVFYSVRDKFQRLVNKFRLFMIIQMGEMFIESKMSQVYNIELYLRNLHHQLDVTLTDLQDHPDMGFLANDSISVMKKELRSWESDFKKVRALGENKQWRTDVPVILDEVYPIVGEIYSILNKIEKTLNKSSEAYLDSQYKISDNVYTYLWLLFIVFVIIFAAVYLIIDHSLLTPISLISGKLQNRKTSELSLINSKVNNAEMNEFVLALNEMQNQIRSRQTELEHIALHDALTNFPNRTLLLDRVNEAIKVSERNNSNLALLILDLNKFKDVNDSLGHSVGDDLLCNVSTRISNVLRKSDTLARLGGDEFSVLLTEIQENTVEEITKKINSSLEHEFKIQGHNLYISSSIGVAIYPDHGTDSEILMRHADIAMYISKNTNEDYSIYNPDEDELNVDKISLASELRNALSNEQFYLEYQAVYDIESELQAFETIINWMHPKYGVLHAEQFFHEMLQIGFSKKMNLWLIDIAIRNVVEIRVHNEDVCIIINLMTWDLQDIGVVDYLVQCLDDYEVPKANVKIALSEKSVMKDNVHIRNTLNRLKENEISIVLYDFGSSFELMAELPKYSIEFLKLSTILTDNIENDESKQLTVRFICDLAHSNNLKVIADGVNSYDMFKICRVLGCDYLLGNYLSKSVQLPSALTLVANKIKLN